MVNINNDLVYVVDGRFAGLPDGAYYHVGGFSIPLRISYFGGTGNDVALTVVPEPATLSLLGLGGLLLAARRRRR